MAATTVEQTGKAYKGWQVIGVCAFIVGLLIWMGGNTPVGVSILVAGTIISVWSRAAAWWHHG